jgi:[acyl-carrier-protein] S-malonyltransferase
MAAILGADRSTIEAAIRSCDDVVIANVNAPGQIVVAGPVDGIEALRRDARDLGLRKVLVLGVGGAFHSPLMASALQELDDALGSAEFTEGWCPVVANVDGHLYQGGHAWRSLLSRQLTEPVQFADSVSGVAVDDQVFVEMGPGGVLSGLVKRLTDATTTVSIVQPSDLEGLEDLRD